MQMFKNDLLQKMKNKKAFTDVFGNAEKRRKLQSSKQPNLLFSGSWTQKLSFNILKRKQLISWTIFSIHHKCLSCRKGDI